MVTRNQKGQRDVGLDLLRAIATIFVITYHYNGDLSFMPSFLLKARGVFFSGVDLFFVLSGFLISRQWFHSIETLSFKQSWIIFSIKRAFRILPNYFLVLGMYAFISIFVMNRDVAWWKFVFFVQNFGKPDVFIPSWSLCVEEHFYLFFPILSVLVLKFLKPYFLYGVVFLLLGQYLLRILVFDSVGPGLDKASYESVMYYPTYMRLDGLTMGVLAGYLYVYYGKIWNQFTLHRWKVFVLGVLLFTVAKGMLLDLGDYRLRFVEGFSVLGAAYFLLIVGIQQFNLRLPRMIGAFSYWTATLSFAMYLLMNLNQYLLFYIAAKTGGLSRVPNWGVFLITLLSLYLFSYGLYRFWETPFMKVRSRILRRIRD